jgi:hypothetical protein
MKAKALLAGVATVLAIIALAEVWATVSEPNGLWAIHEITYKSAISSLPAPGGWDPTTNQVFSTPDYPRADRFYDVRGEHDEIVAFFMRTVPQLGWSYLGERASPESAGGGSPLINVLHFDNPENQCLRIEVSSPGKQAVATEDETTEIHIDLTSKGGAGVNFCEDYERAP